MATVVDPRSVLANHIKSHGTAIASDVVACEAVLRDLCPDAEQEINLLIAAVAVGVAGTLSSSSPGTFAKGRLGQLTKTLMDRRAIVQDRARWAVISWALATGVISNRDIAADPDIGTPRQTSTPPPPPPPPPPPYSQTGQGAAGSQQPNAGVGGRRRHPLVFAGLGAGLLIGAGLAYSLLDSEITVDVAEAGRADAGNLLEGQILVDGSPMGAPGIPIRVKHGQHTIGFVADGWQGNSLPISIGFGEKKHVPMSVVGKPATMTLRSVPDGAEIAVDGKPIGRAPLDRVPVQSGTHSISVQLAGYSAWTQSHGFGRGENWAPPTIQLEALAGALTVAITGDGGNASTCQVTIDDRPSGGSGQRLSMPTGSHTIGCILKGWTFSTQRVEVRMGETASATLTARPQPAIFSIETIPSNASLILDGRVLGYSPYNIEADPIHPHQLEVKEPGYYPVRRRLVGAPGEQVTVKLPLDQVQFLRPPFICGVMRMDAAALYAPPPEGQAVRTLVAGTHVQVSGATRNGFLAVDEVGREAPDSLYVSQESVKPLGTAVGSDKHCPP